MTKRIAIDDATYATLKTEAEENGRTIVGQLRWLLGAKKPIEKRQNYVINGDIEPEPSSQVEVQQLTERLKYFDEDSPEHQEALAELQRLQK